MAAERRGVTVRRGSAGGCRRGVKTRTTISLLLAWETTCRRNVYMQELMGGNGGVRLHFHQDTSAHLGQSKQIGMMEHPIELYEGSCLRQRPQWQRCIALCNFKLMIRVRSQVSPTQEAQKHKGGPVTERIYRFFKPCRLFVERTNVHVANFVNFREIAKTRSKMMLRKKQICKFSITI